MAMKNEWNYHAADGNAPPIPIAAQNRDIINGPYVGMNAAITGIKSKTTIKSQRIYVRRRQYLPENTPLTAKQLNNARRRPFFPANAPQNRAPQPMPINVILLTQFLSASKMQYSTSADGKM